MSGSLFLDEFNWVLGVAQFQSGDPQYIKACLECSVLLGNLYENFKTEFEAGGGKSLEAFIATFRQVTVTIGANQYDKYKCLWRT